MKPYSARVPKSTRDALREVVTLRHLPGLSAAVREVLAHFAGEIAEEANRVNRASTESHLDSTWIRLPLELDESVYDEIVTASRQTGIGRMRLVGVILVSCQDRFAELVKSPYLRGAGDGERP